MTYDIRNDMEWNGGTRFFRALILKPTNFKTVVSQVTWDGNPEYLLKETAADCRTGDIKGGFVETYRCVHNFVLVPEDYKI